VIAVAVHSLPGGPCVYGLPSNPLRQRFLRWSVCLTTCHSVLPSPSLTGWTAFSLGVYQCRCFLPRHPCRCSDLARSAVGVEDGGFTASCGSGYCRYPAAYAAYRYPPKTKAVCNCALVAVFPKCTITWHFGKTERMCKRPYFFVTCHSNAPSISRNTKALQDPIGFVQKRHDVAFGLLQKETPLTSEVRGETTFSKENHEAATVYRGFTLAALFE
jgi:hypothetical protein